MLILFQASFWWAELYGWIEEIYSGGMRGSFFGCMDVVDLRECTNKKLGELGGKMGNR